jgi:AcrR family transcriptional regulator
MAVLAEQGYDRMTIDMVAARADMARATVYRRWATKADLVLAAVAQLSSGDAGAGHLPDTGTLRGDLTAMIRPFDDEQQQVRIRAVTALLLVANADERLSGAVAGAGIGPWVEAGRVIIQRAVDRGEYPPPPDVRALAELIPMMCISRAAQQLPITGEFCLRLIDGVLLPALRGG